MSKEQVSVYVRYNPLLIPKKRRKTAETQGIWKENITFLAIAKKVSLVKKEDEVLAVLALGSYRCRFQKPQLTHN